MRCHVPNFRDATARVLPENQNTDFPSRVNLKPRMGFVPMNRQSGSGHREEYRRHSDANYFADASAFFSAVALASVSLYAAKSIV